MCTCSVTISASLIVSCTFLLYITQIMHDCSCHKPVGNCWLKSNAFSCTIGHEISVPCVCTNTLLQLELQPSWAVRSRTHHSNYTRDNRHAAVAIILYQSASLLIFTPGFHKTAVPFVCTPASYSQRASHCEQCIQTLISAQCPVTVITDLLTAVA